MTEESHAVQRGRFEGAFVAFRYLLGRRDEQLLFGLSGPCLSTRQLASTLKSADRRARSVVLARELGQVTLGLVRRRVDRGSR
jgi:hypothetical protein